MQLNAENGTQCSIDTPSSPQGACHPSERGEFHTFNSYKEIPKNFNLLKRAKDLRKAGYFHEIRLWKKLKGRQMCNLDFHRQQVIGNYIVDFICYEIGLIIEVDGKSHKGKEEYDENRNMYLKKLGFNILHIPVKEVFKNIYKVVEKINLYINETPTNINIKVATNSKNNVAPTKKNSIKEAPPTKKKKKEKKTP